MDLFLLAGGEQMTVRGERHVDDRTFMPLRTTLGLPVARSQSATDLSNEPVASAALSGEKASALT
jgi:hypothetical protein